MFSKGYNLIWHPSHITKATKVETRRKMIAIFRVFVALSLIALVLGHGRLIDPPSRNSAWRYGFDTPRQDTDNELNCGGFNVQWSTNKGKCGVCGDAHHLTEPKYIHPGKYATKTITKTYKEGQEIEVIVDVTSNHQGYFTFSVATIGDTTILLPCILSGSGSSLR